MPNMANADATEVNSTSVLSGSEGRTMKRSKRMTRGFPEFDRWKRGALDIDAEAAPLGRSKPVASPLEAWRAPCSTFDTVQYHPTPIEAVA